MPELLFSSHVRRRRECRLLVSTRAPWKHQGRARLWMSKQEIGFEIRGEVLSNDPSSLRTYVMWKKNKKATKSFSNFPFVWWGGGRRGLPTKHIPVSPVQVAGSLLTAQTTGCSQRELVRVLFSACLCPHDFVLNIFTSLQPPCPLESNALGAGAVSKIQAQERCSSTTHLTFQRRPPRCYHNRKERKYLL